MRTWHRWLATVFAVLLLFIATTGLLSQFAALWPEGPVSLIPAAHAHGEHEEPAPAATATPAGFSCPEGWTCRPTPPPQTAANAWAEYFHHLHSGEEFGPLGTALSILSGFALLFFALSGLWMYASLWRERNRRGAKPRWFWR